MIEDERSPSVIYKNGETIKKNWIAVLLGLSTIDKIANIFGINVTSYIYDVKLSIKYNRMLKLIDCYV